MTQEELLAVINQAAAEGVTELDLSGKGLAELLDAITQLTNLTTLNLWNNRRSQRTPRSNGEERISHW
jgi:internalin A